MGSSDDRRHVRRSGRRARRLLLPLAAGAVGAVVLAAPSVATPAGPVAATPFIVGSASGVAQGIRIVPAVGSYQAPVTIGTSIAGYNSSEGQASAQNLDLGAVGLDLTGPQCDGSAAPVKSTQLPGPLIVESNGKDASATQDLRGSATVPPADAGVLAVTATTVPAATASTRGGALSVPGLAEISGAATHASGGLVTSAAGRARDVTAETTIGTIQLGGGLVSLGSLTEILHQRTGAGATATGAFSIGSLTVAGVAMPVTPDRLAASVAAANAALAPTGVHLTLPVFAVAKDGTATESPLSIGISNSELGHELVAPALGAAQPVRDALENQLISAKCQTSDAFSLGDLVLGAAAGSGSMNLEVGGVSGASEGVAYANPFGSGVGLGLGGGAESLGAAATGTPGTSGTAGTAAVPGARVPGTSAAAGAGSAAVPTVAAGTAGFLRTVCATTHASAHTACDGNWAVPVGLGVLGLVGLLAGADTLRARGRSLRLPALAGRGRRGLRKLP